MARAVRSQAAEEMTMRTKRTKKIDARAVTLRAIALIAALVGGCAADVPGGVEHTTSGALTKEEPRWSEHEAASLETAGKVLLSLSPEERADASAIDACDPAFAEALLSYADERSLVEPELAECSGEVPDTSSVASCGERMRSFLRFWAQHDWTVVAACYSCPGCCVLAVCVLS
jgi:hypothetical protein